MVSERRIEREMIRQVSREAQPAAWEDDDKQTRVEGAGAFGPRTAPRPSCHRNIDKLGTRQVRPKGQEQSERKLQASRIFR